MKTKWMMACVAGVVGVVGVCGMAQAALVTIGNAGNSADTATGGIYGDVAYTYQISTTEVTIVEFMASGAGGGDESYWNDYRRSVGPTAPASRISLYEAMKYCNYLTSGNINTGLYEDKGGGVWGAKFDRATVMAGSVNYFAVPTEDEWYKAAYFKPNDSGYSLYANGTANVPTWGTASGWNYADANGIPLNRDPNYVWTVGYGGAEQNGTYNMMGNVSEWTEASGGLVRGGSYGVGAEYNLHSSDRGGFNPANGSPSLGFRVVSIPEPATGSLMAIAGFIAFAVRRRRHFCR